MIENRIKMNRLLSTESESGGNTGGDDDNVNPLALD